MIGSTSCRHSICLMGGLVGIALATWLVCGTTAWGQPTLVRTGTFSVSGNVQSIQAGTLSIRDDDRQILEFKIQNRDESAIRVSGLAVNIPADISVRGKIPLDWVKPEMIVTFSGTIDHLGRVECSEQSFQLSNRASVQLGIAATRQPDRNSSSECQVTGRVVRCSSDRLDLELEKSKLCRSGKLSVDLLPNAECHLIGDSLSWVQPGDRVIAASGDLFEKGDRVIRAIEVELGPHRIDLTESSADQLERKFAHLSDEPSPPRDLRSAHFVLHTDLSDRQAQMLLEKLETMYGLIQAYFRQSPRQPIECYVVRDLTQWPPGSLDEEGRAKIAGGGGFTMSQRLGNSIRAVVVACDQPSVVQHESVHAFCALTFGSTGPVWYAEGMAELGAYWKPDRQDVQIDPVVIDYLTNSSPKQLAEIVAAGQLTGDSWKAYSWRWALCHLLVNNPNYNGRFKALGMNMMSQQGATFESVYGDVAKEISFEYDQFIQNLGNGYRTDLTAWDWRTPAKKLRRNGSKSKRIEAGRGWQSTGVLVEKGREYDLQADGTWRLAPAVQAVSADGDSNGRGQLVGAVFANYELGETIPFGQTTRWTADRDGVLFLRCNESWTELADDEGHVQARIQAVDAP